MNNESRFLHRLPTGDAAELNSFAITILHSFNHSYGLDQSHLLLWQLMKQGLVNQAEVLTAAERCDLVSFYEDLHEVLIAVNILYPIH